MTYLKVDWLHDLEDQPIELLSELDSERYEIRKLERFRNGAISFAGPEGETGTTWIGEGPIPSPEEIAADPQFCVTSITKDDFERAWQSATVATAA